jgi:hypothetical protein
LTSRSNSWRTARKADCAGQWISAQKSARQRRAKDGRFTIDTKNHQLSFD